MATASTSAPTRMVFLLHGEDPFRTRLRLAELVHSLAAGRGGAPGDLAALDSPALGVALGVTRFDARTDAPAAIALSGQSQGLFDAPGEHRVVVVDHAEALREVSLVEAFPPDAALVLVAEEKMAPARGARRAPARGKPGPAAAATRALPDAVLDAGGRVERIERLAPDALLPWIRARAALRGAALAADALAELATLGADTERLEQELAKLAAYAAGATITLEDVHRLVSGAIEADVFALTRAVVRHDPRTALATLDRLLADGQAVQQIIALLLWQFRVLLFASVLEKPSPAGAARPDPERMAKAIHSSAGAILRWRTEARGARQADVPRAYESLYATDVAIKSGRARADTAALMLCILDLCGVRGASAVDLLAIPAAHR